MDLIYSCQRSSGHTCKPFPHRANLLAEHRSRHRDQSYRSALLGLHDSTRRLWSTTHIEYDERAQTHVTGFLATTATMPSSAPSISLPSNKTTIPQTSRRYARRLRPSCLPLSVSAQNGLQPFKLTSSPTSCFCDSIDEFLRTVPFGDVNSSGDASSNCSANVFDGSAGQGALSTLQSSSSALGNFTTYDAWSKQATLVILTAFNKDVTTKSPRWADTKLLCLTARNVTTGSRIPTSAATSWPVNGQTALLIVGLRLLICAIDLL